MFADLLQFYNGDREKAIRAKCLTYTKNFKEWFKDSKVVDENGEPVVAFYDSVPLDEKNIGTIQFSDTQQNLSQDAVFISKKQLTNEDANGHFVANDILQVKSVDNTGSFSKVDSRIKGSKQSDESL